MVEPTHLKNIRPNGNLPSRGENKKYLKPPPSHLLCLGKKHMEPMGLTFRSTKPDGECLIERYGCFSPISNIPQIQNAATLVWKKTRGHRSMRIFHLNFQATLEGFRYSKHLFWGVRWCRHVQHQANQNVPIT